MSPMSRRESISDADKKKALENLDKPTIISSLAEIRELLSIIMSHTEQKEIQLSVNMSWQDETSQGPKKQSTMVTGISKDSSIFIMLREGMDVVRKRYESTTKFKEGLEKAQQIDEDFKPSFGLWDLNSVRFNVDNLIERRLGAKRNGIRVRWNVRDGIFEFDVYECKLYKIDEEAKNAADTHKTT